MYCSFQLKFFSGLEVVDASEMVSHVGLDSECDWLGVSRCCCISEMRKACTREAQYEYPVWKPLSSATVGRKNT